MDVIIMEVKRYNNETEFKKPGLNKRYYERFLRQRVGEWTDPIYVFFAGLVLGLAGKKKRRTRV